MMLPVFGMKQEHFWESTKKFIYGIRKMIFLPKGEELVTVSFKGWTIGLLICADFGFSELAKSLALKKNADVIMYPSAWNPVGITCFPDAAV